MGCADNIGNADVDYSSSVLWCQERLVVIHMGEIEIDNTTLVVERHDRINHTFRFDIEPKDKSLRRHEKYFIVTVPNRRQLTDDVIRDEIKRWKDNHDVDEIAGAGVMEQFVVRTIDVVDEVTNDD